MRRTVSKQAMHDIKNARGKDANDCKPVFDALGVSKKMQGRLLDLYEHSCAGGRGSVKEFMRAVKAEKSFEYYLTRSLTFFNVGGRSFTCPQFVLLIWNLVTLQRNADASAEWSFRVWFGGDEYDKDVIAPRNNVFEMLDSSLGLSAKYDYRPGSEKFKNLKGFVGNPHDFDVKKGKMLMKSCCGEEDVNLKGWMKLAARAKPVLKYPFAVVEEIKRQTKLEKEWNKLSLKRRSCEELDALVAEINTSSSECLKSSSRSGGNSGGNSGGDESGGSSGSGSGKERVPKRSANKGNRKNVTAKPKGGKSKYVAKATKSKR